MRFRLLALLALVVGLALVAASCGGDEEEAAPPAAETGAETGVTPAEPAAPPEEPAAGGILRVSSVNFEWNDSFDPTGEYLGDAWALYTNMLVRTLVTYRHIEGPEGNEIVPDLAELPEVSEDGLTYTFTLKDGVKFGPPLDRDITSKDVHYAFQRMVSQPLGAQYAFYYAGVIEGFEVKPGPPRPLSGIETPDDKTVVFHLTAPKGDFLNLVAMPATGPIPEEVAKCFTKAGDYGRYLIASGPYMIEGSDQLDITSCDTMKPISGIDPTRRLSLVRNPSYDPATDSPEVRENLIDGLDYTLNTNEQDIFNKIESGELDGKVGSLILPEVVRQYSTSDELKERLHINSADRTWYITMNLTQPPFDDIHVRKAANLVMDKAGLQRTWGGAANGEIATHIIADVLLNDALADYDPYPSLDFAGDVDAAKEEMKQSKYDTDQDGLCDAEVCKEILHVTRNTAPWTDMVPIEEESLKKIGITLRTRELKDHYTVIQTVKNNVPIASGAGWGKDYADPTTFAVLFQAGSIIPEGNINYSLIGLTPEKAGEVGAKGTIEGIPDVEADVQACNELPLGDERNQCWADFDKKLMEEVVPWVPYLDATLINPVGPAVTKFEYDQFAGSWGYAHVQLDPSLQK